MIGTGDSAAGMPAARAGGYLRSTHSEPALDRPVATCFGGYVDAALARRALPLLLLSAVLMFSIGLLVNHATARWAVFLHLRTLHVFLPLLLGAKNVLLMMLVGRLAVAVNRDSIEHGSAAAAGAHAHASVVDGPANSRRFGARLCAVHSATTPDHHALQPGPVSCADPSGCAVGRRIGGAGAARVFRRGIVVRAGRRAVGHSVGSLLERVCSTRRRVQRRAPRTRSDPPPRRAQLGVRTIAGVIMARSRSAHPAMPNSVILSGIGDAFMLLLFLGLAAVCYEFPIVGSLAALGSIGMLPLVLDDARGHPITKAALESDWQRILPAFTILLLAGFLLSTFIDRIGGILLLLPLLCGFSTTITIMYATRIRAPTQLSHSQLYRLASSTLGLLCVPIVIIAITLLLVYGQRRITPSFTLCLSLGASLLIQSHIALKLTHMLSHIGADGQVDVLGRTMPYAVSINVLMGVLIALALSFPL